MLIYYKKAKLILKRVEAKNQVKLNMPLILLKIIFWEIIISFIVKIIHNIDINKAIT